MLSRETTLLLRARPERLVQPAHALAPDEKQKPGRVRRALSQARTPVHEGGFSVERLACGQVRFRALGGWDLDPVPRLPRGDPATLIRRNARPGTAIDSETCANGTGERMDLGLMVDAVAAVAKSRR